MRRLDICLKCKVEKPIVSNGFCRGCYQQAYRAAERSNEGEAFVKPDKSQRRYQEELSEQRIMLCKVVKMLERTHVLPAALQPERIAAIISELNTAIRVIDNAKQFTVNPKIKLPENSSPLAPHIEDAEEFTENSDSKLPVNFDAGLVTESDGVFSVNSENEFSVNSHKKRRSRK